MAEPGSMEPGNQSGLIVPVNSPDYKCTVVIKLTPDMLTNLPEPSRPTTRSSETTHLRYDDISVLLDDVFTNLTSASLSDRVNNNLVKGSSRDINFEANISSMNDNGATITFSCEITGRDLIKRQNNNNDPIKRQNNHNYFLYVIYQSVIYMNIFELDKNIETLTVEEYKSIDYASISKKYQKEEWKKVLQVDPESNAYNDYDVKQIKKQIEELVLLEKKGKMTVDALIESGIVVSASCGTFQKGAEPEQGSEPGQGGRRKRSKRNTRSKRTRRHRKGRKTHRR